MLGLAAVLLILGGVLELLAVTWPLESILPPLFVYPDLARIALSVIVGTATLISTFLPGISQRLEQCQS